MNANFKMVCGASRKSLWILALMFSSLQLATSNAMAAPFDRWNALTEREKTFLSTVFSGDETKAFEYAQLAGINVSAVGGEPLSAWFYRMGQTPFGNRTVYRDLNVQRIVFGTFKQNPNPSVGESNLENYCNYFPFQQNFQVETSGTQDQRRTLREQQDSARRPHIDAMAEGFNSLIRYGLKDRALITAMFKGCMLGNAPPRTTYFYDTVLSRMVKAGANINVESIQAGRPIEWAVKNFNPEMIERLVRDGAEVKYQLPKKPFDGQPGSGPCEPRRYRSIYGSLFEATRPRNPENFMAVVKALNTAGLSPFDKYGTLENQAGRERCVFLSLYDAVVDAGGIDLAKQMKGLPTSTRSMLPPAPAASPNAPPPTRTPTGYFEPMQIGAWRISMDTGRLSAFAKSKDIVMLGLRLECVANGRLEYVPHGIGSRRVLRVHGSDDNMIEMRLVNERASGASAASLSKEFLVTEANHTRNGNGDNWSMEMNMEGDGSTMSEIRMNGFSKMRNYMLANCKNQ